MPAWAKGAMSSAVPLCILSLYPLAGATAARARVGTAASAWLGRLVLAGLRHSRKPVFQKDSLSCVCRFCLKIRVCVPFLPENTCVKIRVIFLLPVPLFYSPCPYFYSPCPISTPRALFLLPVPLFLLPTIFIQHKQTQTDTDRQSPFIPNLPKQ